MQSHAPYVSNPLRFHDFGKIQGALGQFGPGLYLAHSISALSTHITVVGPD